MNEFWLWFWRPAAELLGSLALVAAVAVVFAVLMLASAALDKIKAWRKRIADKAE